MSILSERISELRKEFNLTTRELGKSIGVSNSTIVRWENAEISPKAEYIILLAKFFKVSSDYLLGLEN